MVCDHAMMSLIPLLAVNNSCCEAAVNNTVFV
jgi:hypothetical protein